MPHCAPVAASPLHLRRIAVLIWALAWLGGVLGIALERVLPLVLVVLPGWGTVGLLLARRRPENHMGWVLLGVALLPAIGMALPVEGQTGSLGFGVAATLVLFPTGTLPGRVWLIPLSMLGGAVALGAFGDPGEIVIGEFGLSPWVLIAALALVWCVAAPVVRFRKASAQERAQLRWLGFTAAAAGIGVVSAGLGLVFGPSSPVGGLLLGVAALLVLGGLLFGFPGAILVAVLRYRLYEIDRIVSRTVTYAAVALVVAAVYALPVLLIPEMIGTSSDLVTAGATLAAATAFNPVRRRVRTAVDRRFNRSAYDAAHEVDRLAATLRDSVDLDAVARGLAATATRALQPGSVGVWLRQ